MVKVDSLRTSRCKNNKGNYKYLCMRLTLIMFKFMGLAPSSIIEKKPIVNFTRNNISGTQGLIRFEHAHVNWIYNVFLNVLVFGIGYTAVPRAANNVYPYKAKLNSMFEITQAVCGYGIIIGIWSLLCIKQNSMVMLLNRLMKFDETIWYLSVSQKSETPRRSLIFIFIANALIWIFVVVSQVQYYKSELIDFCNDVLPHVTVGLFVMQYFLVVRLLVVRFRTINRAILDLSIPSIQFRYSTRDDITATSRDYYHIQKIISLKRAHITLYEISSDVSEFYSLPILFAITLTCYSIVYNSYLLITPFLVEVQVYPVFMMICSSSWLLALTLPITMLATSVTSIVNEMKKTPDAVHRVLARSNISREVQSKLEQLSFELLQRKVRFTAYGLFTLDCTLLHSIFSMVITYLIITYQFQM